MKQIHKDIENEITRIKYSLLYNSTHLLYFRNIEIQRTYRALWTSKQKANFIMI